jgi:hypothetical protein
MKNQIQKYEDQVNKILGPVDSKIKKCPNKKLRKKENQRKKQEEKKLLSKVGENAKHLYDFMEDFSSSDYESCDEREME